MLKINLVNSKKPAKKRLLELKPEHMINGECFIGRSRHCGIVLPSTEVSRVHGCICVDAQSHYYFTDLASLGGSRLNHNEVNVNEKYPLKLQDIIRIGEFILTIEAIEAVEGDTSNLTETSVQAAIDQPAPEATMPAQTAGFVLPIPTAAELDALPVAPDPQTYMPVSQVPIDQLGTWTKGDLTVRCAAIIDETPDAKTFRFVADPPILFNYQPGQFVTLKLDIDGRPVKRSYSISSTPSRPHTLEITVKRVPAPSNSPEAPPGLVSNWLHDNLQVGQALSLSGPLGKFTCFANPSPKLLFISAGSGITPMMSMSRWMLDTAANCDIVFFHNARTPEDIIYWKELEWISARNPQFKLAISITRPAVNQGWWGLTGRLNEPMMHAIAPDFWERTVYVCGPDGFMRAVKAMMDRLGFPMANYYEESFGGAKKPRSKTKTPPIPTTTSESSSIDLPVAAPPKSSITLVFKQSGKELQCNGQISILDVAEEEGIDIDSSCRSGVCGTCKVRKLAGTIHYDGEPEALDEDEQEQGYILSCIACPVDKVVVEA